MIHATPSARRPHDDEVTDGRERWDAIYRAQRALISVAVALRARGVVPFIVVVLLVYFSQTRVTPGGVISTSVTISRYPSKKRERASSARRALIKKTLVNFRNRAYV